MGDYGGHGEGGGAESVLDAVGGGGEAEKDVEEGEEVECRCEEGDCYE